MTERVTITIKKDLLRRVDSLVDKREIRNRSHAIESLIAKSLSGTGLETALIMAGGMNGNTLKPLIRINERPVLEHQIEFLKSYGIRKIIIATDYPSDRLIQYFGNGKAYGVELNYITEDKPLGTAGAIGLASEHISSSFIMLNVDTLMDLNIHDIYDFHRKHKKMATVLLTTTEDPSRYGVVSMRGNQIVRFEEKPVSSSETSRLVNAGFCIFDKKVCDMVPKRKMMIEELFNRLCKQDQLMGFMHDGTTYDVGTREGLEKASREWKG